MPMCVYIYIAYLNQQFVKLAVTASHSNRVQSAINNRTITEWRVRERVYSKPVHVVADTGRTGC